MSDNNNDAKSQSKKCLELRRYVDKFPVIPEEWLNFGPNGLDQGLGMIVQSVKNVDKEKYIKFENKAGKKLPRLGRKNSYNEGKIIANDIEAKSILKQYFVYHGKLNKKLADAIAKSIVNFVVNVYKLDNAIQDISNDAFNFDDTVKVTITKVMTALNSKVKRYPVIVNSQSTSPQNASSQNTSPQSTSSQSTNSQSTSSQSTNSQSTNSQSTSSQSTSSQSTSSQSTSSQNTSSQNTSSQNTSSQNTSSQSRRRTIPTQPVEPTQKPQVPQ